MSYREKNGISPIGCLLTSLLLLVVSILFAFPCGAQEIKQVGSPVFISWLPQPEAVAYHFKLFHEDTGSEAQWTRSTEVTCATVHKDTGEPYCGFHLNISSGTYVFSVAWQLADGSSTPWYSSMDEPEGWKVQVTKPCPPDITMACQRKNRNILFTSLPYETEIGL